jgi:citrate synthase
LQVFRVTGKDPLIDIAVKLLEAARADDYFVTRKLYPNVDFFSGLVYRAMGFHPTFFTVLFAVPRIAGYLAHWRESLNDPDVRIARPQQDYQGEWLRDVPDVANRPPSGGPLGIVESNEHKRKVSGTEWM